MSQYRAIQSGGSPQWNSKLLRDLSFIKRNLRCPYGKVMLVSPCVVGLITGIVAYKLWTTQASNYMPVLGVVGLIAVLTLIPTLQYVVALKFRAIETRFTTEGNTALLDAFFAAQNLVAYHHPDAQGVFQLQSRPIVLRRSSTREVIMFIADDGRILINTHYSDFNFGHSVEAREMQRRLQEWLNSGYANNNYSIT